MKVWTVANQKGGVGKTTTAVTLGGLLAGRGERVLLVDMDAQGSLSAYFGLDPDQVTTGVYTLFRQLGPSGRGRIAGLVHKTRFQGLDLLPASSGMATLDRQLGSREGMGLVLSRALAAADTRYDSVLVDCPPALGVLMINALAACARLIIPVQTEHLALKGLDRMLHTLAMLRQARHAPPEYLILPTMFDRRTRASHDALQRLRAAHAKHLWWDVIPVDTQLREASREGIPLSMRTPNTRAARAYAALLETLLGGAEQPGARVLAG